jgi:hypothetical protein
MPESPWTLGQNTDPRVWSTQATRIRAFPELAERHMHGKIVLVP